MIRGARLRQDRARGGEAARKCESLTVAEVARRVHAELPLAWKNRKHAETWLATVKNRAGARLGDHPLHVIGTADILAVPAPIWTEQHVTASRLEQRLSTILDRARGGQYPHESPVNGLTKTLASFKLYRPASTHRHASPLGAESRLRPTSLPGRVRSPERSAQIRTPVSRATVSRIMDGRYRSAVRRSPNSRYQNGLWQD